MLKIMAVGGPKGIRESSLSRYLAVLRVAQAFGSGAFHGTRQSCHQSFKDKSSAQDVQLNQQLSGEVFTNAYMSTCNYVFYHCFVCFIIVSFNCPSIFLSCVFLRVFPHQQVYIYIYIFFLTSTRTLQYGIDDLRRYITYHIKLFLTIYLFIIQYISHLKGFYSNFPCYYPSHMLKIMAVGGPKGIRESSLSRYLAVLRVAQAFGSGAFHGTRQSCHQSFKDKSSAQDVQLNQQLSGEVFTNAYMSTCNYVFYHCFVCFIIVSLNCPSIFLSCVFLCVCVSSSTSIHIYIYTKTYIDYVYMFAMRVSS